MTLDQLQEWRRTVYIPFLKASLGNGTRKRDKLSKSQEPPPVEVIDMIRILTERVKQHEESREV
jgi:hypothetical protein